MKALGIEKVPGDVTVVCHAEVAAAERIKSYVETLCCGVPNADWTRHLLTDWSGLEARLKEKEAHV